MSDDFLSEVSSAIETTTAAVETPSNVVNSESEIASSVLATLEAHEKPEAKPVTKVVKEKPAAEVPAKTAEQEAAEAPNQQQDPLQKPDDKAKAKPDDKTKKSPVPYMDQFLRQDDKNNLVLADGTVIALAGKSRSFFESLKAEARTERENAQRLALSNLGIGERFKELYTQFEELKRNPQRESLEKQTNMAGEELDDAINLIKEYKINPVAAIKRLLTQAQMRGINLKEIGINGGIDPAIVRETIEGIMAKRSEASEQLSHEQMQSSAQEEATRFLTDNPAAVEHVETLAKAKRKFPQKSLSELWLLLQIHNQKIAAEAQEQTPQQQQQPEQRPKTPVTRLVTKPVDYANMSFKDIAASIKKDL